MTSDPGSFLVDQGREASSLPRRLDLIHTASERSLWDICSYPRVHSARLCLANYVQELLAKLHTHPSSRAWRRPGCRTNVDAQTLFRVWDVFFVDGFGALFRTALGILKDNKRELNLRATMAHGDLVRCM